MFSSLVIFLICTNVVYVTKIEDTLICINDTDCSESTDSTIYTQKPTVNDPSSLEDSTNDIEENTSFTTTIPIETTSSRINSNVTEQELDSTIASPAVHPDNDKVLILEKKEICECNLIVRIYKYLILI